jgi:NADH-quinone oxidoreductase subunit N
VTPGLEANILLFLPEILVTTTLLAVIVADLVTRGSRSVVLGVGVLGLLFAISAAIRLLDTPDGPFFSGLVANDPFALFFKIFTLTTTAVVLLVSFLSKELGDRHLGEYAALLLSISLGMCLMASATDLLALYLAIETVSLSSYVLAGFFKLRTPSNEASLKYVIFGALASGLMLYGMSFLFGITGSTSYPGIREGLLARGAAAPALAVFAGVALSLAGFGYKIAAAPFHMWSPDVYEGSPTTVTAFLSVGPKAAGFAALMRFFYSALSVPVAFPAGWNPVSGVDWPLLLAAVSAVTMTVGNLTAIVQTNVKRLLAYSSIAHAGYMLMGAVVLGRDGLTAVLFYLITYFLMNLGAFFTVIFVSERMGSEEIDDYRGLAWRSPFAAIAMTVFLFSLTGLPPCAGFIGKFYLFAAVINHQIYWLAIVGILNSVISLYYYARIIKVMMLREPDGAGPVRIPLAGQAVLALLMIPTILFGLYWTPLLDWTRNAFRML